MALPEEGDEKVQPSRQVSTTREIAEAFDAEAQGDSSGELQQESVFALSLCVLSAAQPRCLALNIVLHQLLLCGSLS